MKHAMWRGSALLWMALLCDAGEFVAWGLLPGLLHLLLTLPDLVATGLLKLWARRGGRATLVERGVGPWVVFVHGLAGHPASFNALRARLRRIGVWNPFLTPDLGGSGAAVDDDVGRLACAIDQHCGRAAPVVLVGLSRGGLLAARYAAQHPDRVRAVITIAAPMQGTRTVPPLAWRGVADLRWRGELARATERDTRAPVFHVVPRFDHLIQPVEAARWPSTPDARVYRHTGFASHFGLADRVDVAFRVAGWIAASCIN